MTMTPAEIRAANHRAEVIARRRFEAERNDAVRPFQAIADHTYNELGLGPAPRRRHGESTAAYKTNLIEEVLAVTAPLPSMSPAWKGFDAKALATEAALDAIAPKIFNDAVAAMHATGPGSGPERVIEKRDDSGRVIRTFAGDFDPWKSMRQVPRYVTVWNPNQLGRGRNATGAIVPQFVTMSDGSVRAAR